MKTATLLSLALVTALIHFSFAEKTDASATSPNTVADLKDVIDTAVHTVYGKYYRHGRKYYGGHRYKRYGYGGGGFYKKRRYYPRRRYGHYKKPYSGGYKGGYYKKPYYGYKGGYYKKYGGHKH